MNYTVTALKDITVAIWAQTAPPPGFRAFPNDDRLAFYGPIDVAMKTGEIREAVNFVVSVRDLADTIQHVPHPVAIGGLVQGGELIRVQRVA